MKTQSPYETQATEFLERHGITFRAVFMRHGKHFPNDTDTRDIYECVLERNGRSVSFPFGQSISKSVYKDESEFKKYFFNSNPHIRGNVSVDDFADAKRIGVPSMPIDMAIKLARSYYLVNTGTRSSQNKALEGISSFCTPTACDLLACLTKSNPGTFDNFCDEYGYDNDSRSAERTYNAVVQEWLKVSSFFTAEEIDELQEIN